MVGRGLCSPDEVATAATRLDDAARYFPNPSAQLFVRAHTTDTDGMIILGDSISRKSERYFEHAAAFVQGCGQLFPCDWQARLVTVLQALSNGRAVHVPRNASGQSYGVATIRLLKPACHLLTHCGNYFYTWESYDELRPMLDTTMQHSFFVVLRAPQDGGELEVFDQDFSNNDWPRSANGMWDAAAIEQRPSQLIRANAGDLVLFDGGRYFHRIRTVRGTRSRLTLGGFVAFSRDGQSVLHWA